MPPLEKNVAGSTALYRFFTSFSPTGSPSLATPAASRPRSTASNTSSGTGANSVHVTAALCALKGVEFYQM